VKGYLTVRLRMSAHSAECSERLVRLTRPQLNAGSSGSRAVTKPCFKTPISAPGTLLQRRKMRIAQENGTKE